MAAFWAYVIVGAAVIATAELIILQRQRRLLLANRWLLPNSRRHKGRSTGHTPTRHGTPRSFQPIAALRARVNAVLQTVKLALVAKGGRPFTILSEQMRDGNEIPHASQTPGRSLTRVVQHALANAKTTVDAASVPTMEAPAHISDANPTEARLSHATTQAAVDVSASPSPRKMKCHAARSVLHWMSFEEPSAPATTSRPDSSPTATSGTDAELPGGPMGSDAPAEEGVVYVDAAGRFTFANPAARALLHWRTGELSLSDVLVGGSQESAALLYAVARQELTGRPVTLTELRSSERFEMSGLPFRDRDGNLWGAALFIRRAAPFPATSTDTPSAPSRQ